MVAALALAISSSAQIMDPQQRAGRVAILNNDLDLVRQALADGWRPNEGDAQGRPSWWQVIPFEFFAALPVLFEGGADPSARSSVRYTALHYAVELERPAAITALIQAGLDPDLRGLVSKEDRGDLARTALHLAASVGCEPCARALVAGGADANALDVGNATPLWVARNKGHRDIVAFLEGLGATDDPNAAAGNPLRRPGAPPAVGGRDPGRASPSASSEDCESQLDLAALTGEGGVGEGDCEDGDGGPGPSGGDPGADDSGGDDEGRGPSSPDEGGGTRPAPPPRSARPVHEVNVGNVLGGPLSGLWGAFQARHPEWRLDANGHITNLEGGTTMTGGTRIDALPADWAAELHRIGVEQGLVVENPQAPYLVAPRGGLAQVMAAEAAQVQAEQAAAGPMGVAGDTPSQAAGR
jgi:hypothetical protein